MSLKTRLVFPLLLATGAAVAPAQRVVVVDASNGPGTDHTDLASAFAALQNDDYIVLRAGTYTGVAVTTSHSFVLVGEGNPVVEPPPSYAIASFRLTMFGSQYQRAAIRGVTFHSRTTGQWALNVRTGYNSWPAPTAQIEDCGVFSLSPDMDRVALLAESVGLTVQRCSLNTTAVIDCVASFVECDIRGIDQSFNGPFSQRAQTAMDVSDSEVWLVDCELVAGNSNGVYGQPASCLGIGDGDFNQGSVVRISGASLLQADQSPSPAWPTPPFVVRNYQTWWPVPASLEIEPGTTLVTSPLGTSFTTNLVVDYVPGHHLTASTAQLGGSFTCAAHGESGDVAILAIGTQSRANVVLGIPFLMETGTAVVAGFGLVDAAGQCGFAPIAIPNDPSLRSTVLQGEALFLTAGGALLGSNPVSGVLFE